jgi:hypothetical protein
MSIRRAPRPEQSFYTLDKSISEDPRLSWAARGLLIFLLGKPDHWEVSVVHLINQTKDAVGKRSSRDAVRVILKELEAVGYLVADQARNATGKFAGLAYTVNEIPVPPQTDNPLPVEPETDFPSPGKPSPENPPLVSTESLASTERAAKGSPGGSQGADGISDHAATFSSIHSSSSNGTGQSLAATSAATRDDSNTQDSLSGSVQEVLIVPKKIGKKATKGVDVDMLAIPDWLPVQRLEAFIDNRKAMKKPMTQQAAEMLIKALVKLRADGHDPLACLDTAIMSGWQGVFAPRSGTTFNPQKKFDPRAYVNQQRSSTGGNFNEFDANSSIIDITP